jgi:hypothetical protein
MQKWLPTGSLRWRKLLLGSLIYRSFYGVYWGKFGYQSGSGVTLIPIYTYFLALVLVDFIVVSFYIRKQQPQGTAKILSYTALIFISAVLIFVLSPIIIAILGSMGLIH